MFKCWSLTRFAVVSADVMHDGGSNSKGLCNCVYFFFQPMYIPPQQNNLSYSFFSLFSFPLHSTISFLAISLPPILYPTRRISAPVANHLSRGVLLSTRPSRLSSIQAVPGISEGPAAPIMRRVMNRYDSHTGGGFVRVSLMAIIYPQTRGRTSSAHTSLVITRERFAFRFPCHYTHTIRFSLFPSISPTRSPSPPYARR